MTRSPRGLSPAQPGFTAAPSVIGVVGCSARAAVHSLARAGFAPGASQPVARKAGLHDFAPGASQPVARKAGLHGCSIWAIDQFADRDLRQIADCTVCPPDGYPEAIPELAKQFPPGPVLYTGGLENHPRVIAELAKSRELWGNPPEALARVRDPFALAHVLEQSGIRTPRLVPHGEPCPRNGRWVRKPFASGGGIGIRFAHPEEAASPHHYFQEWVEGTPMSAVFVNATLWGVTEQLIGEPWLHAEPFAYCGNIGPLAERDLLHSMLYCGGKAVSPRLRLFGLWGVDFINENGVPSVVEVNPRYTASAEVIEHGTGCASLFHIDDTFPDPESRADKTKTPYHRGVVIGKAIYYAPHAITFPRSGPWDADLAGAFDPWRLPQFADIPDPGSAIQRGWPVLTFFASGSTPAAVREHLQLGAAELDRLFAEHSP